MKSEVKGWLHMAFIFAVSNSLALMLIPAYWMYQGSLGESGNNPVTAIYYLIFIIIITAIILLIAKLGKVGILRAIFYFSIGFAMWYALFPLLYLLQIPFSDLISLALAVALVIVMVKNPEWYVMNIVGVLVTMGAALILGLSFGIVPSIVLLGAFAIYDAVSVYLTKHMISLAENVIDYKLPAMFVIPTSKKYSFKKATYHKVTKEKREGGRTAYYMGYGDVLVPGVMVISSASHYGLLAGVFTLIGSLLGMIFLIFLVNQGKPQPGLPFLNTGALIGFITYLLL